MESEGDFTTAKESLYNLTLEFPPHTLGGSDWNSHESNNYDE